jgi:hypothetical protein
MMSTSSMFALILVWFRVALGASNQRFLSGSGGGVSTDRDIDGFNSWVEQLQGAAFGGQGEMGPAWSEYVYDNTKPFNGKEEFGKDHCLEPNPTWDSPDFAGAFAPPEHMMQSTVMRGAAKTCVANGEAACAGEDADNLVFAVGTWQDDMHQEGQGVGLCYKGTVDDLGGLTFVFQSVNTAAAGHMDFYLCNGGTGNFAGNNGNCNDDTCACDAFYGGTPGNGWSVFSGYGGSVDPFAMSSIDAAPGVPDSVYQTSRGKMQYACENTEAKNLGLLAQTKKSEHDWH